MTVSLVPPPVAHLEPGAAILAERVYGYSCGASTTIVPADNGAKWYVCPTPCGRHAIPVDLLDRAVTAEVLNEHPEEFDPADPVRSVVAAVHRHVTHVHIFAYEAGQDGAYVAHFRPIGGTP